MATALFSRKIAWVADGYRLGTKKFQSKSQPFVETEDNFLLYSETGPELRTTSPASTQQRRVKSATTLRMYTPGQVDKTDSAYDRRQFRSRPNSAQASFSFRSTPQTSYGRTLCYPGRRVKSAGPVGHQQSYQATRVVTSRESPTSVEYSNQSLIQAGPDHQYFDRHARCHGHTHIHNHLLLARPRKACQRVSSTCPSEDVSYRPKRPASGRSSTSHCSPHESSSENLEVYTLGEVRYMQSMRPRTAPVTVGHLDSMLLLKNIEFVLLGLSASTSHI